MSENIAPLQVQNQTAGNAVLYILWVTSKTPCVSMFWMLKGPDNDWTKAMKEKGSGTKQCRDVTADSDTNGVKLDRHLIVLWLAWFINSSLHIYLAH